MATLVLTDASVSVGGTDLSDHVRSVTLEYSAEEKDFTAMGATARSRKGGLKDASVSLEFLQDFAASEVDATIWPLVGTNPSIIIKPTSGAVTATNPSYTGNFLVSQYQPLANGVGDEATTSVTWPADGDVTRATS